MDDVTREVISAATVEGWFKEWNGASPKARQRKLPNERQCKAIAKALNDSLPLSAKSGVSESYKRYFARLREAADSLRSAVKPLQKAKAMWSKFPDPKVELPYGFDSLLSIVMEFLKHVPDEGFAAALHLDTLIFTNLTLQALKKAGWKSVSQNSDKGPVMFVVARCLSELHGVQINPATLARSVRAGTPIRPRSITRE